MANVIKLKRGSGSDPSASDLVVGEVAIRTDSGKLFTKKDNGTIAEISGSGGGSDIFINTLSSSSGSGGGSATFNGTATRFTLSNPPAVSAQQLLVSINGVIQKPNSGTSPSEGFAIDGNDIIFAAAPATGSDFFIVTYGSLNIAVPADNSVTSAKIVDGTIVGTDLATNVDLVDNQKIRFGTGNDLQIYHDGSHSRIVNGTNGGTLRLQTAGSEEGIVIRQNGAVELYYDNSKKFETKSFGVQVTGELYSDGLRAGDNEKLRLGDGEDLQIYHDGSNSYLDDNGTGDLQFRTINGSAINLIGGSEYLARFVKDGAVELYHDGNKKFETTSSGVTVTGTVTATSFSGETVVGDPSPQLGNSLDMNGQSINGGDSAGVANNRIKLGAGDDLQIYHDGSTSYIKDTGTGNLRLATSKGEFRNAADTENLAAFTENGSVELFYDHVKKFETTSYGALLTGNLKLEDNRILSFGDGDDLQISHDGTTSLIKSPSHPIAHYSNTRHHFLNGNGSEVMAVFVADGQCELYHDNSKKFETHSGGVSVFGNLSLTNADSYQLRLGAGSDFRLYHDGSHSYIKNSTNYTYYLSTQHHFKNVADNELQAKFGENAGVELYYDNSKKLEVFTWGVEINGDLGLDDNRKLALGNGPDFLFYHNGSASYIQSPSHTLFIQATTIDIGNGAGNEAKAKFIDNGAVELYYDNSKKFETTSTGVKVSGTNLNMNSAYIDFSGSISTPSTAAAIYRPADNTLAFSTANQHRMRINPNGKILINRSNEDGNCIMNIAVNSGGGISVRTAVQTSQTMLDFGNQNGVVGSIKTSGTGTSFNTSSDHRLKENAVAISDGITRLKTLKPYRFNFKADASTTLDGFFAHEVTAVPEAISGTKDAVDEDNNPIYQGIDQSKLVPLLVAALQEAVVRIEALEAG